MRVCVFVGARALAHLGACRRANEKRIGFVSVLKAAVPLCYSTSLSHSTSTTDRYLLLLRLSFDPYIKAANLDIDIGRQAGS